MVDLIRDYVMFGGVNYRPLLNSDGVQTDPCSMTECEVT